MTRMKEEIDNHIRMIAMRLFSVVWRSEIRLKVREADLVAGSEPYRKKNIYQRQIAARHEAAGWRFRFSATEKV